MLIMLRAVHVTPNIVILDMIENLVLVEREFFERPTVQVAKDLIGKIDYDEFKK